MLRLITYRVFIAFSLLALLMTTQAVNADEVERISLQDFARHSQFITIKISPTGEYLAATMRSDEGRVRLVTLNMSTMEVMAAIEGRAPQSVGSFEWANDNTVVASMVQEIGSFEAPVSTGEIYSMSVDGRRRMALTGPMSLTQDYVQAGIFHLLPEDDNAIMIYEYSLRRRQAFMELSRVLLNSGRKIPAGRVPLRSSREGGTSVISDAQGVARVAMGLDPDDVHRSVVIARDSASSEWRTILNQSNADFGFRPIALSADGRSIIGMSRTQTDTTALAMLDMQTGEEEVLAHHPRVDLRPITGFANSGELEVLGASFEYGELDAIVFEDVMETPVGQLMLGLQEIFPAQQVNVTSATRDMNQFIIQTGSANHPEMFYMYDRENNNLSALVAARSWLDTDLLPVTQSVGYEARDGLPIQGLLTLPHYGEISNLPLIMLPHGGPHGVYDSLGRMDSDAKVLASHGYAVLQPNFRGSGNFGGRFETLGYRRWGTSMIDDMTDGVRFLIEQGIVDGDRVCTYGGSYGGYAALQSAIREPELYKCTIGFVGVYDLDMMYTEGDIPRRANGRAYLDRVLPREGDARNAQSPIHNLEKLQAPVLLIHGGQDFRVPQVQAEQLRDALKARNHPQEWMDKRFEGHGFYNPDNNVERWELMLDFIERHIGEEATSVNAAR